MNEGRTIFAQVMDHLPHKEFARCVTRYGGERYVKTFSCMDQFLCMGSSIARPVDVRVVAATNRDLKALVDEGKFRVDLYYRLAAAIVQVPSLRERSADIMMLARAFAEECGVGAGSALRIQPAAARILRRHPWPGNARELQSAIMVARARAKAEGRKGIGIHQLTTGLPVSAGQFSNYAT